MNKILQRFAGAFFALTLATAAVAQPGPVPAPAVPSVVPPASYIPSAPQPIIPAPTPAPIPLQNGGNTNATLATGTVDDGNYLVFGLSAVASGVGSVGVSYSFDGPQGSGGGTWFPGEINSAAGCFTGVASSGILYGSKMAAKYWRMTQSGTVTSGATTGWANSGLNINPDGLGWAPCSNNSVYNVQPGFGNATLLGGVANAAASTNTVTLTGASGQTTYMTEFDITGGGATTGSDVVCTLTGATGGTRNIYIAVPTGVTANVAPLFVSFGMPGLPSFTTNTNLVLSCPTFGSGNTAASVNAAGYRR